MRTVDHKSADRKHARVRMSLERGDDFLGMADLVFRGGERGVDDRDLRRVDCELARKPFVRGGSDMELRPR